MLEALAMRRPVAILYILVAACHTGSPTNDERPDGAAANDAGAADAAPLLDAPALAALCGVEADGTWRRCQANPLVVGARPATTPGTFEWTQADPTVLYDATDQLWKAWWSTVVYTDCAQVTTSREIHIKYAESDDGVAWRIQAEPALRSHRSADDWDFSTAETPSVIRVPNAPPDRRFALIYAGGNDEALRVLGQTGWQLGLAFSPDGRSFTRLPADESPYAGQATPFVAIDGLVLLARDAFPGVANVASGIVADPEVIAYGGAYHLYFSSVAVDAAGGYVPDTYGISQAVSTDLIHWTPAIGNPIPALYGGGQPTILADGAALTMYFGQDSAQDLASVPSALFATRGFWRATSSDGRTWARASTTTRDFTWAPSDPAEDLGLLNGAALARGPDGIERLYYTGWGTQQTPAGSCVFVWDRTSGSPQLAIVRGTHNLALAIRR